MVNLTIIMYHYVRDLKNSRYPEIKGLDLPFFQEQIRFLKTKFNFVSTEQVLEGQLPERAVLLTFDDGYIDHYTNVFPILKEEKISGFFSMPGKILAEGKLLDVNKIHFILASQKIDCIVADVFSLLDFYRGNEYVIEPNETLYQKLAIPTRFDGEKVVFVKQLLQNYLSEDLRNIIVDKLFTKYIPLTENAFAKELYMSYDQVRFMKREGMFFGVHGYDHYWLGKMDRESMQKDIKQALDVFDSVLDRNKWVMCYPYGSHSADTVEFIARNGCELGFTTQVLLSLIYRCSTLCCFLGWIPTIFRRRAISI